MLAASLFLLYAVTGGFYYPVCSEPHSAFPYSILLVAEGQDSDQAATLFWAVDFEKETVDFRLSVPLIYGGTLRENGEWFAFGMSPDGTLSNADLVVFEFPQGELKLTEAYTDDTGEVHEDGNDHDYVLLGWRVSPGVGGNDESPAHLEVEFRRKFDTCDRHDYLIDSGTVNLFYLRGSHSSISSGYIDPREAEIAFQRAQLLKSTRRTPPLPPNVKTADIVMHNTAIPNQATTYWCRVQKFPDIEEDHHIIQYEAVVTPGNEGIVHHMEVFHCILPAGVKVPDYNGECEGEDLPAELASCRRVIGAWAMGAKAFFYPEEVGVPIGGSSVSSYVVLQVHYNNPRLREGVLDSSGIRFHYTSSLRPYDAGILEIGATYSPNLSIPPESNAFYVTGYCSPDCTDKGIPDRGIRVFASQLHTHLSGTAIWTKHIRNGVEMKELNRDDHYNAMFQEIRFLQKDVTVLPGDALITTCRYDTSARQNVTLGGFGIQDEMCVNYMHYYPSINLEVCKSTIASTALAAFFKTVDSRTGDSPHDVNLTSPSAVANCFLHMTWTPSVKLLWQYVINEAPLDIECLKSSGQPFTGKWKDQPPPSVKIPLPRKKRKCPHKKIHPFQRKLGSSPTT
ncbi:dopamine beta-hydroxylase-like isoform X1 [Acanthaster planci]|uniref:Dopamine beta-hydroxylase-like isoform X1 n=1 Tax=Acanthaster planci TaxID=133434 RepID=A0A8B7XZ37_ACAPL|nr:dopamine beta-hydroxylase-like isoform X1 [Acanthaster planci]